LTTDFRDIRDKWQKTAIFYARPSRESPDSLDFRDPFFPEMKMPAGSAPTGIIRSLVTA
jgi:hypothetical protein